MATVYLARDLKHQRRVALKLLNPELGAVLGPERFLSEIRVTANLQHPNLLALFDSGETNGLLYYVMPFVEGETLRQRLDREKQLPVDEAVRLAVAVASALEYAHQHGVIHRDLKPENILLQAGQPVIADFGIALAVSNAGGSRVTQTGLSLGTPQYMSPEQATGDRAIDARTDVYSLGAVLYEMLAGEPPHSGTSAQAIIAKLMTTTPPPVRTLRPAVPANVAMAVEKALAKLPADRFASAREFAEALTNPGFTISTYAGEIGARPTGPRRVEFALALFAAACMAAALWGWLRPAAPKQVLRYDLALDSTEALSTQAGWGRFALSPDGSQLVYVGGPKSQLMLRARNELHAKPILGTEGASTPFFSPDGQQVGFIVDTRVLKIVSLNGSAPAIVTDTLVGLAGATWSTDGYIYADGMGAAPLVRVRAKVASTPTWFTALDSARGEVDEIFPDVLPNGKSVLFTAQLRSAGPGPHYAVELANVATRAHRVLIDDAYFARYAEPGHLLYVTSTGTMMVAPFDLATEKITGDPVVVGDVLRGSRGVEIAVSRSGTLLYVGSGGVRAERELVWVTRDGKWQHADSSWRESFSSPALAPDGKRLAVQLTAATRSDIWVKQMDAGPAARLTLEGGMSPAWSPDGRSVLFVSRTATSSAAMSKPADGSAQPVPLVRSTDLIDAPHQSPDGKWLVFQRGFTAALGTYGVHLGAPLGIYGVRLGADSTMVPLVATTKPMRAPALSPDGRWLAYLSAETGRSELYVVPFPNTSAARWIVSTHGANEPAWSHSGSEIFFRDVDGMFQAVAVKNSPTFSVGRPTPLFSATQYLFAQNQLPQYAVAPDDKRFLFIRSLGAQATNGITVVENWSEELKKRR